MSVLDKRAQRGWHVPCRVNALQDGVVFVTVFTQQLRNDVPRRPFNIEAKYNREKKQHSRRENIDTSGFLCVRPCLHYTNAIDGMYASAEHMPHTQCYKPFRIQCIYIANDAAVIKRKRSIRSSCNGRIRTALLTQCKSAGILYTHCVNDVCVLLLFFRFLVLILTKSSDTQE